MKVLLISHMYPSASSEVAGIFVHEQARALVRARVEVRVISPIPWTPWPVKHLRQKWRAISKVPRKAAWNGIPVDYPRYPAFPRAWFFASSGRRMYRGIKGVVESIHRVFPFDLIHAHVALPDGYAGAPLVEAFGCPLVVTIHGQDLQQTVHRGPGCRKALARALHSAARVVVVSHKLEHLAHAYFPLTESKTVVVPNGVDPKSINEVFNKPYRGDAERPVVVSVSNLVKTKGVDLNLQAICRLREKHPKLRYTVIGGGPEASALKELARRLRLEGSVAFLGSVSHEQALQQMSSCDVFSLPSWNEGFGIVYLEAMACAKPVIGCKGEGIEDIVKDGETGLLVEPRSVDGLVEALEFLLTHPGEAKTMGEHARRLVLDNYTWEKNAEKTLQVYREVLDGV